MTVKDYSLYLESQLYFSNIKFKVYYAKTNSCYIRIKDLKGFIIRISDHKSKWRYSYDVNINQDKNILINETKNILNEIKRRLK